MRNSKNSKGQMEMSIGTIVTIVLMVTLLVLGVVLIKDIFSGAKDIVNMGTEEAKNQIGKGFSEEDKVTIYPSVRIIDIKKEDIGGVGLGIQNLLKGTSAQEKFSYEVVVADSNIQEKCKIDKEEALSWIKAGKSEENIAIPAGDYSAQIIRFEIPSDAPLCLIRYRVNVKAGDEAYATDIFDLNVIAK